MCCASGYEWKWMLMLCFLIFKPVVKTPGTSDLCNNTIASLLLRNVSTNVDFDRENQILVIYDKLITGNRHNGGIILWIRHLPT